VDVWIKAVRAKSLLRCGARKAVQSLPQRRWDAQFGDAGRSRPRELAAAFAAFAAFETFLYLAIYRRAHPVPYASWAGGLSSDLTARPGASVLERTKGCA
jgi:hypothetical protein